MRGSLAGRRVEALKKGAGLCMGHLLQAVAATDDPVVQCDLVELHIGKFTALLGELQEFCRKRDYRHAKEPFGDEKDSWIRAARLLSGLR